MFQYCDHMYFYAYSAIICVYTSRCRSVAGFDLHRISISSSTCVCLSQLHHQLLFELRELCSPGRSRPRGCFLYLPDQPDATTTLPDQLRCNHLPDLPDQPDQTDQPHCQMSSDAAIVSSNISVAKSCFQTKIQFC